MNACLLSANIDQQSWFIGTYTVRPVELNIDDLLMIASPVFGGPLVHVFKTGHVVERIRSLTYLGGAQPREWTYYTINLWSCGPEDSYLVLEHLQELIHNYNLLLPEREHYWRYRHDQLEPVEEDFTYPRFA